MNNTRSDLIDATYLLIDMSKITIYHYNQFNFRIVICYIIINMEN